MRLLSNAGAKDDVGCETLRVRYPPHETVPTHPAEAADRQDAGGTAEPAKRYVDGMERAITEIFQLPSTFAKQTCWSAGSKMSSARTQPTLLSGVVI